MILVTNILELSFKLTERASHSINLISASVLFCFFLIAIAKLNNPQIFSIVTNSLFSLKSNENNFNEENRLSFVTVILLNLNFFISLLICIYLLFSGIGGIESLFFYSLFACLYLFIIQQLSFQLLFLLSKNLRIRDLAKGITYQIWHFAGFLQLIIALSWSLNRQSILNFEWVFLFVISILLIFRYIKGVLIYLKTGIKWYYLILYLCTLEILPTFLFYHFLMKVYLDF